MANYKAKRDFISPDLGNVVTGQILSIPSESRAKNWIGAGLIEPVPETKPGPKIEIDLTPAPSAKKGRIHAKRGKSADGESASEG